MSDKKKWSLQRTIDHGTSKRMVYHSRESDDKNMIMQCGQLKLLCTETSFLTRWASPGDVVVYVGGGNGIHLPTIARMFPMVHFDVFDVMPPSPLVMGETSSRFSFIQRKFNMEDAVGYSNIGDKVLFISDARPCAAAAVGDETAAPKTKRGTKMAAASAANVVVRGDGMAEMVDQKRWVEAMKPRQALLRFKLPYDSPTKVEYLSGTHYIQPFTKRSSTETRLEVSVPQKRDGKYSTTPYDCRVHEEVMFHHNNVTRREHLVRDPEGSGARASSVSSSYDHRLAHAIISDWVDRAMVDPDINGGLEVLVPYLKMLCEICFETNSL